LFDTVDDRLIVVVWGPPGYGGVFVAQGATGRWVRLGEGLDGHEVLSLALLDNTILAGTDDGIFQRAPDANVWTRVQTVIEGERIRPRVTDLIALEDGRLVAGTATGILQSSDGGEPGRGLPRRATSRSRRSRSRAVIPGSSSPRRNLDSSAATMEARRGGARRSNVTPHALAFAPANRRVLYTTTTGGLFRSGDLGETWRRVDGGLPHSDLTGLAMDPNGRTLYVSDFTWGGVFRSADGGSTWDRMPTTGLGSDRVWALSLDPAAPERVLAASSAGGLHVWAPASTERQQRTLRNTSTEMQGMRHESSRSF
jgi:photosystem II stability/assembly factor-like uncharacterized protein